MRWLHLTSGWCGKWMKFFQNLGSHERVLWLHTNILPTIICRVLCATTTTTPFQLQAQDDPDPFGKALDLLSELAPETSSPNAMDLDVIVEVEGAKAPVVKTAGTVTCEHCQVTWMKDEICRGWWGWLICCFWLRCLWLFLFLFSSSLLSSPSSSLTIQRSKITKTKEVSAVPVFILTIPWITRLCPCCPNKIVGW